MSLFESFKGKQRYAFQQALNDAYAGKLVRKINLASGGVIAEIIFSDETSLGFKKGDASELMVDDTSTSTFKRTKPDVVREAGSAMLSMSFMSLGRMNQLGDRMNAFCENLDRQYAKQTISYIEIGERGNVYIAFENGSIMTVSCFTDAIGSDLRVNGLSTDPRSMSHADAA